MAIAKNVKPTTKNSPSVHTGANRDNKSADYYSGFNYPAGGSDKDIGVYKQPMPNPVSAEQAMKAVSHGMYGNQGSSVAGDRNAKSPTDGVSIGANKNDNMNGELTMRGFGAATKGNKTRGPMA
jgi:hypothetical protein